MGNEDATEKSNMLCYRCRWGGKEIHIIALTAQRAQTEAARLLGAKRVWEVQVKQERQG